MKKISLITAGLALPAILSLFLYFYNSNKSVYVEEGNKISFENKSYDNTYNMIVSTEKYLNIDFINVIIIDNNTQKEVYKIKNEYRDFDFKWIIWEEESNSFWINSSDLGIFCYAYIDNNTWDKYSLKKKEGGYYLQKGNKIMESENEVLNRKLPNGYHL